jgi:tetratricopeptide (TPR) repeat protein
LVWQGQYEAAETFAREAIETYENIFPERHPFRIYAHVNLGIILSYLGKPEGAERELSQAIKDENAIYGFDNISLANTYGFLSDAQLRLNDLREAEKNARISLKLTNKYLSSNRSDLGTAHTMLANILFKQGKYSAAETEARNALEILKVPIHDKNLYLASAQYVLCSILFAKKKPREAELMLRENLDLLEQIEAPKWRIARSQSLLGAILVKLKRNDEALTLLRPAYEALSAKNSGASSTDIFVTKSRLEQALRKNTPRTRHRIANQFK